MLLNKKRICFSLIVFTEIKYHFWFWKFPRRTFTSLKRSNRFQIKDCRNSTSDHNYDGKINITRDGHTCIHWNKAAKYQSQQENYCRTPARDPYNDNGPWCYFDTKGGRDSCNVPICDSASCPYLSLRAHLQTQDNKDSYRYGETVNLECDTGHKLNGFRNLSCQESGNWSNIIPTCAVVTCHGFSNEHHQKWHPVKLSYIYNDNVTFTCDEVYTLASSTSITCQSDGTWSDIKPNCTGILCSPLPKIDKALLPNQTKDYRYPETVKVTCETGYTVEGYDLLQCNSTGFWSSVPQCTSIDKPQSNKDSVEIRCICMSYGLFGGILTAIVIISAGVYVGTCFYYSTCGVRRLKFQQSCRCSGHCIRENICILVYGKEAIEETRYSI